jgi:shikimate kinase
LHYQFADTDQWLEEKAGYSIPHIFSEKGEEYFRDLETDVLLDMQSSLHWSVISTGGGLPVRKRNRELLREMGHVIYLKASKDTLVKRLSGDTTRPLLQGDDPIGRVEKLLHAREPIYEEAAHEIIVTDHRSIDEIAEIIGTMVFREE